MGYYHHSSKQGYLKEGQCSYQQYQLETIGKKIVIAYIDQEATIKPSIPFNSIPADEFMDERVYKFYFASADTAPIYYKEDQEDTEWRKQMIQHINVKEKKQMDTLRRKQESKFHIISDGRVSNLQGTFGVVITNGHNIIATNLGKLYSIDYHQSSY
jgi:hypothetical protein